MCKERGDQSINSTTSMGIPSARLSVVELRWLVGMHASGLVDSGAVCTTGPPGTALGNPP